MSKFVFYIFYICLNSKNSNSNFEQSRICSKYEFRPNLKKIKFQFFLSNSNFVQIHNSKLFRFQKRETKKHIIEINWEASLTGPDPSAELHGAPYYRAFGRFIFIARGRARMRRVRGRGDMGRSPPARLLF
jgi:hypothetical protein